MLSPNVVSFTYIAFDPGKTTGWATFDAHGKLLLFHQVEGLDGLTDFLEDMNRPKRIITEDFIVEPGKLGGKRVWASEAIGIIHSYAYRNKIDLSKQLRIVKPTGYTYAQAAPPARKADEHKWDAVAHGTYYLQTHKIRRSAIYEEYGL